MRPSSAPPKLASLKPRHQFYTSRGCQGTRSQPLEFKDPLQVQACLARDFHAIPVELAPQFSAPCTQLPRSQRGLAQSIRPVRRERATNRTSRWVLVNPYRRAKESRHIIDVALARSGDDDSASAALEPGERREVGRECPHLLGTLHHDEVIPSLQYKCRLEV